MVMPNINVNAVVGSISPGPSSLEDVLLTKNANASDCQRMQCHIDVIINGVGISTLGKEGKRIERKIEARE